jgi:Holliday junction DNA helicase RuvA
MSLLAHIRGTLEERGVDWLIVDVGGVGFRVGTSASTLSAIGSPGERVALHTHLVVREDDLTLYGFTTADELAMFETLIGVSGVGPRVAIALLSTARPDELAASIAHGDVQRLTGVSGVGRRTAERLVVELKDKLRDYLIMQPAQNTTGDDVLSALMALGYTRVEAQEAASKLDLPQDTPIEERVRVALAYFARR